MNEPPVFAFAEAALFWVALVWAFLPEIRHSGIVAGAPSSTQDAGTLRLINIGSDVALLLAFALSFLPWLVIPYPRIALYAGTGLLVAGSLLRRYCFRILGKYFTAAVTVSADQPVIDKGPYRWIRHPGYAAGLIMFLGIGLALGNWLSLIIFFIEICYVYGRRVKAEEKALLGTIGEPYRAYMARTKRFIPFIF
jgi:protein-S-isoprenylcysteine O-methyltransferase Ste14